MNKEVEMDEMIPIIREQLAVGKTTTFSPKGTSMLPMLRDGIDTVTLKKPVFPLKKYDLPLYQRSDGSYVLHRVVGIREHTYGMRGDHQLTIEWGIQEKQVIGVVDSFTRKGKEYSCNHMGYRMYCHLWNKRVQLRKIYVKGRKLLRRVRRKIRG